MLLRRCCRAGGRSYGYGRRRTAEAEFVLADLIKAEEENGEEENLQNDVLDFEKAVAELEV
jgi:hypothetical protein